VPFARDTSDDLASVLPAEVDLLVDTTAMRSRHAEQICALGDRVGAAVVLSTLSVYSDPAGRSLDSAVDLESFPAWPLPLPESWTTLPPGDDDYSHRKVAVERVLVEQAPFPCTILRPGAIYGENSRHLREWYFIKRALDQRRQVVLPFNGESIFQPTAAVNLAELAVAAARRPGHRVLNCGDLDPPTVARISETVDGLMNWSSQRVLVSGPPPGPGVGQHPWAVPRPVVADMSRAREELGYQEAASYGDALASTLTWALQACSGRDWREVFPVMASYPLSPFDYAAEDAYLASRAGAG
jgi:nucleoside-diphosphate-sugar epimerase